MVKTGRSIERLLLELAKAINIRGLSETSLILRRQFYRIYPQIRQVVSDELKQLGFNANPIPQLATDELHNYENQALKIVRPTNTQFKANNAIGLQVPPDKLVQRADSSKPNMG
jgi:hypothetical protein